jgi:hypothetical protein
MNFSEGFFPRECPVAGSRVAETPALSKKRHKTTTESFNML